MCNKKYKFQLARWKMSMRSSKALFWFLYVVTHMIENLYWKQQHRTASWRQWKCVRKPLARSKLCSTSWVPQPPKCIHHIPGVMEVLPGLLSYVLPAAYYMIIHDHRDVKTESLCDNPALSGVSNSKEHTGSSRWKLEMKSVPGCIIV